MAKPKKVAETQTETIQRIIFEGRKVVMKKENEKSFVRIRFNNSDSDGTKKWRLLINGNEFYASEITINCPARTLTEKFEENGVEHHIICEAIEVVFKDNVAHIN